MVADGCSREHLTEDERASARGRGRWTRAWSSRSRSPLAIRLLAHTSLVPLGDVRIEAATLTGDIHGGRMGHRWSRENGPIVIGSGVGPTIAFRSTSGDLSIVPRAPGDAGQPRIAAESTTAEPTTETDDTTLSILRALEHGEIDLAEARTRLAAVDADESEERDG
jgi:hypothetical protein